MILMQGKNIFFGIFILVTLAVSYVLFKPIESRPAAPSESFSTRPPRTLSPTRPLVASTTGIIYLINTNWGI